MLNKAIKKAKENKKGFTLAELLIVVAIIAVLVAISIPIFTSQLEKSRDAVTIANVRAAYAQACADYLSDTTKSGKAATIDETVVFKGVQSGFSGLETQLPISIGAASDKVTAAMGGTAGTYTITFSFDTAGVVSISNAVKK